VVDRLTPPRGWRTVSVVLAWADHVSVNPALIERVTFTTR